MNHSLHTELRKTHIDQAVLYGLRNGREAGPFGSKEELGTIETALMDCTPDTVLRLVPYNASLIVGIANRAQTDEHTLCGVYVRKARLHGL